MTRQPTAGPLFTTLGDYLRKERKARGLYQQNQLGRKLGLSRERISAYERGFTRIPIDLFVRWCQVMDLDPGVTLNQVVTLHEMRQAVRDE